MNTEKVKVSVIIPAYNVADNIRQALKSVLLQTLKDIEIICIDDGSTDETLSVIKEFQEIDRRIIVKMQKNAGAGNARNLAMSFARGEYIAFLDADDWYPSNHVLENLYTKAKEKVALVCGGSFSEYKNGRINTRYDGLYSSYTFEKEGFIEYKEFQFDYGYIRFIYNREFLSKYQIKFPSYRRFQDPPFFVNTMIHVQKFYAIPDVVYCYRRGEKKVHWNDEKISDVIKGITDILTYSSESELSKLHATAVTRINSEYYNIIMKRIRPDNLELIKQLIDATKLVKPELLIREGWVINCDKQYLLKPLRNSIVFFPHQATKNQLQQKNVLRYIMRKISGGVQCYKDNGFKYTAYHIKEKIVHRLAK